MDCDKCGTQNTEDVKFCVECGENIEADIKTEVEVQPEQVQQKPTVVPAAPPVSVQSTQPRQTQSQPVQPLPQVQATPVQVAPAQTTPVQTTPVQQAQIQQGQMQQQQAYGNSYQQPVAPVVDKTTKPMTFWGWLWSLFVLFIPLVNLVFIIVWSFSGSTNKSKQSFARVHLVFIVLAIVLSILMALGIIAVGGIFDGVLDSIIDAAI